MEVPDGEESRPNKDEEFVGEEEEVPSLPRTRNSVLSIPLMTSVQYRNVLAVSELFRRVIADVVATWN